MHCRWYDKEPTMSLAVSLMKNSTKEIQSKCADFLIDTTTRKGVEINDSVLEKMKYPFIRWYDEDKHLREALEYLKHADEQQQKEIALELIEFIQKEEFKL